MECRGCGVEFTPTHGNQRYCLSRCRTRKYAEAVRSCRREAAEKTEVAQRTCLRCGESFESAGPQNRICERCKTSGDWQSGLVEYRAPGG